MTEAMTNCHHHAYSEDREDGLNINIGGWWMFLEVRNDKLSILICDLGIGIPRSLPKTHKNALIGMLKDILGAGDSACIDFAAQTGSTSTDMANRGKGLRKMVNIVREIPGSRLSIFSNRGFFSAENRYEIMRKDHDDSMMGTLVSWSVDLTQEETS